METPIIDPREYKFNKLEDKEEERRKLLSIPDINNKIGALASQISGLLGEHTRVLVDMRPGATFYDTYTKQMFEYETSVVPWTHETITELILEECKYPVEQMKDRIYFVFRTGGLAIGKRFLMSGRDFVSYFAIKRFVIKDLNNTGENEFVSSVFKGV